MSAMSHGAVRNRRWAICSNLSTSCIAAKRVELGLTESAQNQLPESQHGADCQREYKALAGWKMALFAQLLLRVLLEMKREWPLKVMLRELQSQKIPVLVSVRWFHLTLGTLYCAVSAPIGSAAWPSGCSRIPADCRLCTVAVHRGCASLQPQRRAFKALFRLERGGVASQPVAVRWPHEASAATGDSASTSMLRIFRASSKLTPALPGES